MKYYLIEELNKDVFVNAIMLFLANNKGWQLHGGPFVDRNGKYCQAMIKINA